MIGEKENKWMVINKWEKKNKYKNDINKIRYDED